VSTLESRLAEVRAGAGERLGEENWRTILGVLEQLRAEGLAEEAARPGDRVEDFTLVSAVGEEIRLGDLLGRGPVVLTFYRGEW
jgi:hypothetical protein